MAVDSQKSGHDPTRLSGRSPTAAANPLLVTGLLAQPSSTSTRRTSVASPAWICTALRLDIPDTVFRSLQPEPAERWFSLSKALTRMILPSGNHKVPVGRTIVFNRRHPIEQANEESRSRNTAKTAAHTGRFVEPLEISHRPAGTTSRLGTGSPQCLPRLLSLE